MPYADKDKRRMYANEYRKILAQENPDKAYKYARLWRKNNPGKYKESYRLSRLKLKDRPEDYRKSLEHMQKLRREKYHSNIVFRLYSNTRSRITSALARGKNQKIGNTESIVGCSINQLKDYIESKFTEGMSWGNKGSWHIDHIKSCASFDLSDPRQLSECFHYSNLQPLWGIDNRKKGAHFDGYHHNSVKHRKRNKAGQFLTNIT